MINIGITGTRNGMTVEQTFVVSHLLKELYSPGSKFRHGDCIGVDQEVHDIARVLGYYTIAHPPKNPKNRAWCNSDEIMPEEEYMIRNCDIVNSVDRMIACPKKLVEEFRGSGTWHAIRYSKRISRRLYLVWPNGRLEFFNAR